MQRTLRVPTCPRTCSGYARRGGILKIPVTTQERSTGKKEKYCLNPKGEFIFPVDEGFVGFREFTNSRRLFWFFFGRKKEQKGGTSLQVLYGAINAFGSLGGPSPLPIKAITRTQYFCPVVSPVIVALLFDTDLGLAPPHVERSIGSVVFTSMK